MNPKYALNAPQATLMAAIARGIITHHMQWGMLMIGVAIGAVLLLLNELVLERRNWQMSVLSVGFGIYLPPEINIPLIVGGLFSWIVKRNLLSNTKHHDVIERCGVLLACGWIVGESMFGLFSAVAIGITKRQQPFALVGADFVHTATILSTVVFIMICMGFYYYIKAGKNAINKLIH